MSKVELFLNEEICLDINSEEKDVAELSKIIETDFPGFIKPQKGSWNFFSTNLLKYWTHAKEDNWELVFVNRALHSFDAYKRNGAKRFSSSHPMLTAGEILKGYVLKDIHEDEMMDLLEVEV